MNTCPRCNIPLSVEEHGDIHMENCRHCGGRWLSMEDLKAIVEVIALRSESPIARQGVDLTDVRQDAPCPRCGVPMEPFNYAADSGIILDKCHHCDGLWLDGGDLERVLAVVTASGQDLDRDVKRFSADLHEAEVRQDALEQRDSRPAADSLSAAIANSIADSDPRP
jgi:Zn-finger nucleic acid-binding protein